MRARLALIGALALAGCGGEIPDEAAPTEGAELIPATQPMGPGLYAVGDGTTVYARTRLSADGTYTDMTEAGETVGGGSWSSREDVICFDPEGDGEDQQERCWRNEAPDKDGSFRSLQVDGEGEYRVMPLEE